MTSRAKHFLRRVVAAGAAASLLTLAACSGGSSENDRAADAREPAVADSTAPEETEPSASSDATDHSDHQAAHPPTPTAKPKPLRAGERRETLSMAQAYTPSPPTGKGTDDYRCFLLDPGLVKPAYLTGTTVLPGNPDVVHHVIMFHVDGAGLEAAKASDAESDGPGWTCFGDMGFGDQGLERLDDAQWLGAWAPGGSESVAAEGFGTRLTPGSQIVMQVHYNLLQGAAPDTSGMQLRLAPGNADITPLKTMLLPAPVELPCRAAYADGPLCDRAASVADVKERFGDGPGAIADGLHLLCNSKVKASRTTTCTRTIGTPTTIRAVGGHMHLLGRKIKVEVNPGTDRARTILDIPVWNFDDQGARPIEPVALQPWDTVKVTCTHTQTLRDKLPAFEGIPDKYVVWGEGTTDEMCLGILTVTRP